MDIIENINLNRIDNDIEIGKKQNNFLNSTIGKVVNTGLDFGLRAIFPDLIENQVIKIKDTLFDQGLGEGIKQAVSSAIDLGKSAVGILTGNFENIHQAQIAVQKGGIIDEISEVIDFVLDKTQKNNILPSTLIKTIKGGKNSLLNSVSNNIENVFNEQLQSSERLEKYSNNWKNYFNNKDFEGMIKEFYKINSELKNLMPMENTLKEARVIQNLHTLIKNNGQNFNLTNEQLELSKLLTW